MTVTLMFHTAGLAISKKKKTEKKPPPAAQLRTGGGYSQIFPYGVSEQG